MEKKVFIKKVIVPAILLCMAQGVNAQSITGYSDDWYVGVGAGLNFSMMNFSDLDKDRFPKSQGKLSPVYSVFLQKEFGRQHSFVVRPQLTYLLRGGKLTDIDRYNGYSNTNIKDISYSLNSHFLDVRLPLLYQFGGANSGVRPYFGVTPLVGFSTGGDIRLQNEYKDFVITGYEVDLNNSNFSSTYFAVAPTLGLRFDFRTGRHAQNVLFVNLEATFEISLSDTYGSKEKDGKAIDVVNNSHFKFDGTRKFSGPGFQVMVGIPFSAFKRSKTETSTYVAPVISYQPASEPDKPCYTLDEINDLIVHHKSVKGKTICAISDINFEFGKSNIQKRSYPYLDKLAQTIIKTNASIEVKGHTDNVGSDEFNMKLSKQRAESVVNYLVNAGVDKDKISYSYYGSSRPLTTNDTEEGRTMNRRVEFEIF